jgi:hypothetical protein
MIVLQSRARRDLVDATRCGILAQCLTSLCSIAVAVVERGGQPPGTIVDVVDGNSYILLYMLMVVFGAGASYDSIDVKPPGSSQPGWYIDEEFRPPLAKDLFGFRGLFADAMANFEKLQPIVPILRHAGAKNVETVLRELQDEAGDYPERLRQLMAVRYYLHFVIRECERRWRVAKPLSEFEFSGGARLRC